MLTEICEYLKNWFDRKSDGTSLPKYCGTITISGGEISIDGMELVEGQYFRIIDSLLNDGVYRHPADGLKDETFEGAVWLIKIPPAVLAITEEIEAWQAKYGGVDSAAMSPYQSESFGGYSYSKSSGYASASGNPGGETWQGKFAGRLSPWRKMSL